MSHEVEFVKQQILNAFERQKADAGHALNTRGLMSEVHKWNPKQQDALSEAINQLEVAGLIENRDDTPFLTDKGVDHLYPDPGDSVKQEILSYFASSNARVGHAFNTRSFMSTQYINWNPKQKRELESAMSSLVSEGVVEERNGSHFLTQKGYDLIY